VAIGNSAIKLKHPFETRLELYINQRLRFPQRLQGRLVVAGLLQGEGPLEEQPTALVVGPYSLHRLIEQDQGFLEPALVLEERSFEIEASCAVQQAEGIAAFSLLPMIVRLRERLFRRGEGAADAESVGQEGLAVTEQAQPPLLRAGDFLGKGSGKPGEAERFSRAVGCGGFTGMA
jgi:hypothetical protein